MFFLTDPPDHVQLNSSTLIPRTGSSVTLTCSARSTLSTKFRFVEIKSANRTTVQDGHSQTLTISSINFEHFLNYKAMYQCIAYNMLGDGLSKNVTLDIQGMINSDYRSCLIDCHFPIKKLILSSRVLQRKLPLQTKLKSKDGKRSGVIRLTLRWYTPTGLNNLPTGGGHLFATELITLPKLSLRSSAFLFYCPLLMHDLSQPHIFRVLISALLRKH